jgi:GAF domain-containing protein
VQDGKTVEWVTRPYQAALWLLDSIIHVKASRLVEQNFEQELKKDGLKYWPEGELPQSWLATPMIVEDRVIGVLAIESRSKPRAFGENGVRVLSTVARQAAVAIENARLVDQRDRKIASLRALYEMGQKLNAGIRSDEPAILQLIYRQASRLMDTSNLYIALYDEKTDTVSFPLMYVDGQPLQVPSRKRGEGRTEWIIQNRQPILIETCTESVVWYEKYGHEYIGEPFASWVGVPMMARDKVLGVIATYHKTQDYVYTKDDLEILSLMANQAAVAIENARLYQELNEKVQELEIAQTKIAEQEAIVTRTSIAADLVHRLNNLAGTIPIWVDQTRGCLDDSTSRDQAIARYLDRIESDAKEILGAAEKLNTPPEPENVDIKSVLETLFRQALVQMSANIKINLRCEGGLPTVYGMSTELNNALWSMMENGMDSMPEGGTLEIEAKRTIDNDNTKWVAIQIRDQGEGIAEVNKVFLPFYSTRSGHMGYGLWRAKNVFERVGGSISFESVKGIGTTFTIKLPSSKEVTQDEQ